MKHSVLYVRFGHVAADFPVVNAETVQPEEALQRLTEGSSWAAVAHCGHDGRPLAAWLMRVRHGGRTAQAGVVALVPDVADPVALVALRAGADAVLPESAPPTLIRSQVMRLRERLAPACSGTLHAAAGVVLHAPARRLWIGETAVDLRPQLCRLLWALLVRPGRVVSLPALRLALDIPARCQDQTVHTAVGRLRRLLRPHGLDGRVQTVYGDGYRWAAEEPQRR